MKIIILENIAKEKRLSCKKGVYKVEQGAEGEPDKKRCINAFSFLWLN